jgi:hypothetical protein
MISHSSVKAISKFLRALKTSTETTSRRVQEQIHDYLGMTFDFSLRDEDKINMTQYISKVIKAFPEEMVGKAVTPASDHLFKV